jgi:hypothetical protein
MKIVTAHQIEHLAWLGLLDKFNKADSIILCDSMQFEKDNYHNRNKIRTKDGWQWLTVPVEHNNHKPMKEIKINGNFWIKKYLRVISQNYNKSTHFNYYYPTLEKIINKNEKYLIDLNMNLIYQMWKWFGIKKEFCFLSQLNIDPKFKTTDLLIEISKATQADIFLAGMCGNTYIEQEKFKKANIILNFHQFTYPIYKQLFQPFIPGMSSIDYLFNNENEKI